MQVSVAQEIKKCLDSPSMKRDERPTDMTKKFILTSQDRKAKAVIDVYRPKC